MPPLAVFLFSSRRPHPPLLHLGLGARRGVGGGPWRWPCRLVGMNSTVAAISNVLALVYFGLNIALSVFILVMAVAGLFHLLKTRADAFPAIGRVRQNWVLALGAAVVLALLSAIMPGVLGIMWIISAVIVGIYWQDVRPAIRDILDNSGGW